MSEETQVQEVPVGSVEVPIENLPQSEFKKARKEGVTTVLKKADEVEAESDEDSRPKKSRGGTEVRIDKLTRAKNDEARAKQAAIAERDAEREQRIALAKRIEELEARVGKKQAESSDENEPEESTQSEESAQPEKFPSFSKWMQLNGRTDTDDALPDWIDARDAWKKEVAEEQERVKAETEAKEKLDRAYKQRAAEAAKKDPQLDAKIEKAIMALGGRNKSVAFGFAIQKLSNGPEVMAYLGEHPDTCKEINGMDTDNAIMTIGVISKELKAQIAEENDEVEAEIVEKPERKKYEPIKPVGGTTKNRYPLDHPNVSQQEYKRRRAAGEIR